MRDEKLKILIAIAVIAVIALFILDMRNDTASAAAQIPRYMQQVPDEWDTAETCEKAILDAEEMASPRVGMVEEIVLLWTMFFDDEGARKSDPRRSRFVELAGYLADSVIYYQGTETDIGGKLPGTQNDHLMLAQVITEESSVTPHIKSKSKLREVGSFQLHGVALAGHKPEAVRRDAKLGILLGVRWIASRIPLCPRSLAKMDTWEDSDWEGPLSLFAGGEQKARGKNGWCARFKSTRRRVHKMQLYRVRMDAMGKRANDGTINRRDHHQVAKIL